MRILAPDNSYACYSKSPAARGIDTTLQPNEFFDNLGLFKLHSAQVPRARSNRSYISAELTSTSLNLAIDCANPSSLDHTDGFDLVRKNIIAVRYRDIEKKHTMANGATRLTLASMTGHNICSIFPKSLQTVADGQLLMFKDVTPFHSKDIDQLKLMPALVFLHEVFHSKSSIGGKLSLHLLFSMPLLILY